MHEGVVMDENKGAKLRQNLASQPFMVNIGAEITAIDAGQCEISVAYREGVVAAH